jgi:hypothetical protein
MSDRSNELSVRMALLQDTDRCRVFLSLDSVYLGMY